MATLPSRAALTDLAENDLGYVHDVSDTTDSAQGTSKKFELTYLRQMVNKMVGQVKINSGNTVQPVVNLVTTSAGTAAPEQIFNYDYPLAFSSSPTTLWPPMDTVADQTTIWDDTNNTFLENDLGGQVHLWRFIFTWNKPIQTAKKFMIRVRLYNALSSFTETKESYVSEETSTGDLNFNFITIADSFSLPSGSGQGYNLAATVIGDNASNCDITLVSTTRISLASAAINI